MRMIKTTPPKTQPEISAAWLAWWWVSVKAPDSAVGVLEWKGVLATMGGSDGPEFAGAEVEVGIRGAMLNARQA